MDQQAGSRDAEGTLLQRGSAVQMLRALLILQAETYVLY